MTKTRLTTTLADLRKHNPCAEGWATLLKSLPTDTPQDKPVNLLHILKSNGVQDMMWALRAATPDKPKLRVAMCADMAARVLKRFETKYPEDKRPRHCIEACRKFVRMEITQAELRVTADATNAVNASVYAAECQAQAAIIRKYLK